MNYSICKKSFGYFVVLILTITFSTFSFAQGKSKIKGKGKGDSSAAQGKSKADKNGNAKNGNTGNVVDDILGADRNGRGTNPGTSKRFNGLAKKIGMSPERAQVWYETERRLNPDLTYGQFVAANMVARKHGSRYPRLTTKRILRRMQNGDSLGQAVKGLGLKDKDYKKERKRIDKAFKKAGKKDKKDRFDYRIGT